MAMKCSSAARNINPALQNYLAALVYVVDSGKGKARTGKKGGEADTGTQGFFSAGIEITEI